MTWGRDRSEAIARMKRCLDVMVVEGIKTNASLHRRILDDPDFRSGPVHDPIHGAFHAGREGAGDNVNEGVPRRVGGGQVVGRFSSFRSRYCPIHGGDLADASYYFRDFLAHFLSPAAVRGPGAARRAASGLEPFHPRGDLPAAVVLPAGPARTCVSSDPVFVSWLLTLHLPLAALAAYWLARRGSAAAELGGVAAGVVYSLGGLTLSSLNLYVFLQALALAPFVVGTLRRAAIRRDSSAGLGRRGVSAHGALDDGRGVRRQAVASRCGARARGAVGCVAPCCDLWSW